jgi:hypothetical protein
MSAGAPTVSVVCGQCGREARLAKRACAEHPDLCARCYRAYRPRRPCGVCGRVDVISCRARDGQPDICGRCASQRTVRCGRCGQQAPFGKRACAEHTDLCKRCYRAYQPQRLCGVCGRVGMIRLRARDGRPDICTSCSPKPTGRCGVCGKTGRLILKANAEHPALGSCCYRPAERRCSRCGQTRRCRYVNSSRPLCYRCAPPDRQRVSCSGCGKRCYPQRRTEEGLFCGACDYKRGGTVGECQRCVARAPLIGGYCSRCRLALRIEGLREAGDPEAVSALSPYLSVLSRARNADSVLRWLQTPTRHLLDDLLAGKIALTHEALDATMEGTHAANAVAFVRAALVHEGVLPERDEMSAAFARWSQHAITTLDEGSDRALVRAYATWQVAHQLARSTQTGKASLASSKHARSLVTQAINLTHWLHTLDLELGDLRQNLIDEWIAQGNTARRKARLFLQWLQRNGTTGELHVAWNECSTHPDPLSETERFAILRTLLHGEDIDARDRLAGSLLLLYAQPLTRAARLTTGEIYETERTVGIKLARGVVALPEPLACITLELRQSAGTGRWLFPGRKAGTHISPDQLLQRLKRYGITGRAGRQGALLALAARLPAPILAERLGIHQARAAQWVRLAGATYADYVALRT